MSVAAETVRNISFTEAYHTALDEALAADPTVFLLGEDIGDKEGGGVFKVTKGLSTKYGDKRVRTTPISEEAIVGAAIGAALVGMRPVAEIMLMTSSPWPWIRSSITRRSCASCRAVRPPCPLPFARARVRAVVPRDSIRTCSRPGSPTSRASKWSSRPLRLMP